MSIDLEVVDRRRWRTIDEVRLEPDGTGSRKCDGKRGENERARCRDEKKHLEKIVVEVEMRSSEESASGDWRTRSKENVERKSQRASWRWTASFQPRVDLGRRDADLTAEWRRTEAIPVVYSSESERTERVWSERSRRGSRVPMASTDDDLETESN